MIPTKLNISLFTFVVFIIITPFLLFTGLLFTFWNTPITRIKCGTKEYIVYTDIENPIYMYAKDNNNMNSKWGINKSIMYSEKENGVTKLLWINKSGVEIKPNWNVNRENKVESDQFDIDYRAYLDNSINFIPNNNIITDEDKSNFKICYPNATFKESNDL